MLTLTFIYNIQYFIKTLYINDIDNLEENMDSENIIYQRKSIRSFSSKKLSDNIIEEIVLDGTRAPSWENAQPWEVYVATGNSLENIRKQYMDSETMGKAPKSDLTIPGLGEWSKTSISNVEVWGESVKEAVGEKGTSDPEMQNADHNLFYAPAIVYITANINASEYSIYDIGAFGQTLMLAAKSKGVDSIPAFQFVKYPDIIKNVLEIPDNQKIVVGIGLGYADNSRLNNILTRREPIDQILHIKK
ncbi:nitroreductase [Lactobacillus salsicarnum]|uniref:Nitroreductase n=2 Tax=Companilactobacillus mishanensis TaxID=2486008 RepID=A0A5P0ZHF1_9LACO|nr:nitroreductase [Companilactobacillus mishanensis]